MLKAYYASTFEVDDQEAAIQEILGQVDFSALLENSIGILGCSLDYIAEKTVEALCRELPFEVVGGTTYCSAVCNEYGEDLLSLLVLTSDDVRFSCAVTEPLSQDTEARAKAAYDQALAALPGKPAFGILLCPYLTSVSSDRQIKAFSEASGNLPIFGSVMVDYTDVMRIPRTIYQGADFPESAVILLVSGNIAPRFLLTTMPKSCFFKQEAIITSSADNVMKEVNNIPARDYLVSLGLATDAVFQPVPSVALSVDTGDGGLPVARAIFAISPEGEVVCGGDMPEGAVLGVGSIGKKDVFASTTEIAETMLQAQDAHVALFFSCLARSITLGSQPLAEIELFQSILKEKIPYLFMYSGGELYPEVTDEMTYNKAHNDSIIVCIF